MARLLHLVGLGDVQAFADALVDLAPGSRERTLATVESLLAFGQRVGYLPFNEALRPTCTRTCRRVEYDGGHLATVVHALRPEAGVVIPGSAIRVAAQQPLRVRQQSEGP